MFYDGGIYTELVTGAGRLTKCHSRVEMSVERRKNLLFHRIEC